ncbi:hypothetical protein [Pseudoalteromonas sp. MTN2-4]|uniref:hypothetical protein n=1 Tax=Pseudoalteromonas sp. MTN2-4 TaxID=3056555 RepID=UPI0036F34800
MGLNCTFCNESVINSDPSKGHPVSIAPYGVAHSYCAQQDLLYKRVFQGVRIAELDHQSFLELKEMVLTEDNVRSGMTNHVDLF